MAHVEGRLQQLLPTYLPPAHLAADLTGGGTPPHSPAVAAVEEAPQPTMAAADRSGTHTHTSSKVLGGGAAAAAAPWLEGEDALRSGGGGGGGGGQQQEQEGALVAGAVPALCAAVEYVLKRQPGACAGWRPELLAQTLLVARAAAAQSAPGALTDW